MAHSPVNRCHTPLLGYALVSTQDQDAAAQICRVGYCDFVKMPIQVGCFRITKKSPNLNRIDNVCSPPYSPGKNVYTLNDRAHNLCFVQLLDVV
jgi:hypothetical protein